MAQGNGIIVSADPKGKFLEGIISGTDKPGTMMQIKAATAKQNGRFTWEAYNRSADGNRGIRAILLHDDKQGQLATDAYVTGKRCFLYVPISGEEMNILFGNQSGTGDDIAIGDYLIADDGTGKFYKSPGSVDDEPFIALEAVSDPTADQLLHAMAR